MTLKEWISFLLYRSVAPLATPESLEIGSDYAQVGTFRTYLPDDFSFIGNNNNQQTNTLYYGS